MRKTYGTDPELMIVNIAEGKNEIISALRLIPNYTKHRPNYFTGNPKDGGIYSDNTQLEFSVPPAESPAAAVEYVSMALYAAATLLRPYVQYPQFHPNLGHLTGWDYQKTYLTLRLLAQASHTYDLKDLPGDRNPPKRLDSDRSPASPWEIGCNPNFDAYRNGLINEPSPFPDGQRTGSFHIHLGNADYKALEGKNGPLIDDESKHKAVKLLDIFVGLASVIFDKDPTAPARRKLYGRAGEFRPTPYGVEYRVLGPYCLRNPRLVRLVYDLVDYAIDTHLESKAIEQKNGLFGIDEALIQNCINDGTNAKLAQRILNMVRIPANLNNRINETYPDDLYKTWRLV